MRTLGRQFATLIWALMLAGSSLAQPAGGAGSAAQTEKKSSYPTRPVTTIVGFGAGGASDGIMRQMNETARAELGQPFIVENRPGAAGSVAISMLKTKAPDGYSIGPLLVGSVINQHIRSVNYDTDKDLTPIIMIGTLPQGIVVRSDARWKDIRGFLEYAKANPNSVRYSTAGIGTAQHFTMEHLGALLGIKWIHVPYKSGIEAVSAVVSGEVEASAQTAEWTPFVQDGRLRLLAVFTDKRLAEYPQVPNLKELGYPITVPSFIGLVGPANMDPAIVKRLHDAYVKALDDPRFLNVLKVFGVLKDYKNPDAFKAYLKEVNAHYAQAVGSLSHMVVK